MLGTLHEEASYVFLLLRGTKVTQKKCLSMAKLSIFHFAARDIRIFQNCKGNPFSPSGGKNSQVNKPH
jgi:ribonuclease D